MYSSGIIKLGILFFGSGILAAPFPQTESRTAQWPGNGRHWHHFHGAKANNHGVATTTDYTTITDIITITVSGQPPPSSDAGAGTTATPGASTYVALAVNPTSDSNGPGACYFSLDSGDYDTAEPQPAPPSTSVSMSATGLSTGSPSGSPSPSFNQDGAAYQSGSPSTTSQEDTGGPSPMTGSPTNAETVASSTTAPSTSTTSTTPSPAANSYSSTSGGKKGIAYNDVAYFQAFSGYDIGWAYNWASSPSGSIPSGIEYVAMLWGNGPSSTNTWQANAQAAISGGSTHLVAFNEPDLPSQSNIDPTTAAQSYSQHMSGFPGNVKLGAPAVSNGGAPSGLTWLQNFLDACGDCQIDFIPIHWYGNWDNVEDFQNHATTAHQMTGKPIWVTEFGTNNGNDQQIESFLQNVTSWMDQQPWLERYAYFMAATGNTFLCDSFTSLSGIGLTYVQTN